MPVLPDVGSTSVVRPGVIRPAALHRVDHVDADAVLDAGDRVEELELGQDVGLARPFRPPDAVRRTSGVSPIVSVMES